MSGIDNLRNLASKVINPYAVKAKKLLKAPRGEFQTVDTGSAFNSDIGDGVDYLDPKWFTVTDAVVYNLLVGSSARSGNTSGSASIGSNEALLTLKTGATSGSVARQRAGKGDFKKNSQPTTWDKDRYWSGEFSVSSATSDPIYQIGVGRISTGSNGLGFEISGGDLKGIGHNSTSKTSTTRETGVSNAHRSVRLENEAGNEVRFFHGGSQKGSISSGLPSGIAKSRFFFFAKAENTTANNRELYISDSWGVQMP
jgi:hypothetical protein